MNKPITKNIIFRLLFPVIFGLFAYLIMLMIFDNVSLIIDNFFSKEVAFFIFLSFTLFESLLFTYGQIEKQAVFESKANIKLALYILLTILLSVLLVSFWVSAYFILIENTSVFKTELSVFNFIMLFASFLYLTIFYSIGLINRQTKKAMTLEVLEKENIDKRLKLLQSKIRPEILYQSLEILIDLIHQNEKQAEEFINKLSSFYRNIIEERHNETVSLNKELNTVNKLISLLNNKYKGQISINPPMNEHSDYQLIPGTIQQLVFVAVQRNIISENIALNIDITIKNDFLFLSYTCHERLTENIDKTENLAEILNKYEIFSERKIVELKKGFQYSIQIPMLRLETV